MPTNKWQVRPPFLVASNALSCVLAWAKFCLISITWMWIFWKHFWHKCIKAPSLQPYLYKVKCSVFLANMSFRLVLFIVKLGTQVHDPPSNLPFPQAYSPPNVQIWCKREIFSQEHNNFVQKENLGNLVFQAPRVSSSKHQKFEAIISNWLEWCQVCKEMYIDSQ